MDNAYDCNTCDDGYGMGLELKKIRKVRDKKP
jgi:hypothetical protein